MTLPEAIALHMFECQPRALRTRLLQSQGFRERLGLSAKLLTINGVGRFAADALILTARRVFDEGRSGVIRSIEGVVTTLSIESDAVVIKSESSPVTIRLKEMMILSPRPEQRVSTLRAMSEWLGPTSRNVASLLSSAEQRPLTDEEVLVVLDELRHGLPRQQAKIGDAIRAERIAFHDIAPGDLSYYEKFAGPAPEGAAPDEYIRNVLVPYWQSLVEADLARGLELCLSSLRLRTPGVSPGVKASSRRLGRRSRPVL